MFLVAIAMSLSDLRYRTCVQPDNQLINYFNEIIWLSSCVLTGCVHTQRISSHLRIMVYHFIIVFYFGATRLCQLKTRLSL